MHRLFANPVHRLGLDRLPRSLGAKLVLLLTGVGLAGSVAIAALLGLVITPSFNRLEHAVAAQHVVRAEAAIEDVLRKTEAAAHQANAAGITPGDVLYLGDDGRTLSAPWRQRFASVDRTAFVRQGNTLFAVGVAQRTRGVVVVAHPLSSGDLATRLQLPTHIDIARPATTSRIDPSGTTLAIAVPILDRDGVPIASAHFSVSRDLSLLGQRMLLLAVAGVVVLLLIVLAVLRRAIAQLVLRPLHEVERHMGAVRATGTPAPLPGDARSDEIGSLVASLNAMLRQLHDLREQVERQSFKLGASESAVAVMHNVRNALNPISTILSQGIAVTPAAERVLVDRAVLELANGDAAPDRRAKLASFVSAAIQAEAAERDIHRRSMKVGREALHNVLEIIGKQQLQAHEAAPLSTCDVSDIVAQNAAIARYSADVSIAFMFPSKPHLAMANRVILSQVIGNLLANAGEAIAARGGEGGSIAVSITESGGRVQLVIRDDGEGFKPGAAQGFFQRGFSMRAHKSGGLGLHWCANAMLGMGGTLSLESEGPGTGARAILTLASPPAATSREIAA